MDEKFIRNIFYYKNFYLDFLDTLKPEVRKKFNWTLKLIATLERIPVKHFKHMEGSSGIYEIRVEVGSDIYRIFSFFDKGQLVILQVFFEFGTAWAMDFNLSHYNLYFTMAAFMGLLAAEDVYDGDKNAHEVFNDIYDEIRYLAKQVLNQPIYEVETFIPLVQRVPQGSEMSSLGLLEQF